MVKANAYGLGMLAVSDHLRSLPDPLKPWAFGVASVAEGEQLRTGGWSGRILVFSPILPAEFQRAADAKLTLCISDLDSLRRWADVTGDEPRPFHVEIDTGMGRAGMPAAQAAEWGQQIVEIAGDRLRWEGTYTHFHSADESPPEPTREQWTRFRAALEALPEVSPRPLVHAANSAGIFRDPDFALDLVRPGIYLYGGRAGDHAVPRPVASVRARLSLVRDVPSGATVGYGATYSAVQPEKWGTLAVGYGDGIRRMLATHGGEAIVRGRRVPIIGRISMDMTTVDLTGVGDAAVGDVATLIGRADGEEISVDEVAGRYQTISYEVLTSLSQRLPRVYLDGEPWEAES